MNLLGCHTEGNATCSRRVYLVSTLNRDFLMKNIGLCVWFSSYLNKVTLTETSKTATYR